MTDTVITDDAKKTIKPSTAPTPPPAQKSATTATPSGTIAGTASGYAGTSAREEQAPAPTGVFNVIHR